MLFALWFHAVSWYVHRLPEVVPSIPLSSCRVRLLLYQHTNTHWKTGERALCTCHSVMLWKLVRRKELQFLNLVFLSNSVKVENSYCQQNSGLTAGTFTLIWIPFQSALLKNFYNVIYFLSMLLYSNHEKTNSIGNMFG